MYKHKMFFWQLRAVAAFFFVVSFSSSSFSVQANDEEILELEAKRMATQLTYELKNKPVRDFSDDNYLKSVVKELSELKFNEVVEGLLMRLAVEIEAIKPAENKIEGNGVSIPMTNLELIEEILISLAKVALPNSMQKIETNFRDFESKAETIFTSYQARAAGQVRHRFHEALRMIGENGHVLEPIGELPEEISKEHISDSPSKLEDVATNTKVAGKIQLLGLEDTDDFSTPTIESLRHRHTLIELFAAISAEGGKVVEENVNVLSGSVTSIVSDQVQNNLLAYDSELIIGRDEEADQLIDILVRPKGGHPALVGPSFSGKTTVLQKAVEKIVLRDYPQVEAYKMVLGSTHVVNVSAMAFAAINPIEAMRKYFNAIEYFKSTHKINIVTYLTDIEKFPPIVMSSLEQFFVRKDGPQVILEGDSAAFSKAFQEVPRVKALIEEVEVRHLAKDKIVELLGTSMMDEYGKRFNVVYENSAIEEIIVESKIRFPELGPVEAANRFMQDVTIYTLRTRGERATITGTDVKKYLDELMFKMDNPLADAELMERLNGLLPYLNNRVFGWEETNEAINDAVFAHMTQPARDRRAPLSIFLVGSTGTGKSEIAKAIAYHLFGSDKSALVLNMGSVTNETEKNKLFGAPPGYIGYGSPTELENFIIEHEATGAVILWDEISNIGGASVEGKEALFKLLYDLIEEGQWTAPHKSQPYDLKKFVFIFTGNDGEHLFQGVSADDLRLAIWMESNRKERLKAMLRERGVPEAFIGRMADLILAKPLTVEVMKKITLKFLSPVIDHYKKLGVNIEYDEQILEQFAETFFAQSSGARSVRAIFEQRLRSYISQVHYYLQKQGYPDKQLSFRLELNDNLPKEAFVEDLNYKRQVKIAVVAEVNGTEVHRLEKDVTDFAPKKVRLSKNQAVIAAFHEAGHAATNHVEATGEKIAHLTIMGEDDYLGYARWEPLSDDVSHNHVTKRRVLYMMARLLAGQRAQQLAGFQPDAGWSDDIKKVRTLAYRYFVEWGDPEESSFLAIPTDKKGEPILSGELSQSLQKKIEVFVAEADSLVVNLLVERWDFVEALAQKLIRDGSFSGEEYEVIQKQVKQQNSQWVVGSDGRVVKKGSETLMAKWKAKLKGRRTGISNIKHKMLPKMTEDGLAEIAIDRALLTIDISENSESSCDQTLSARGPT